MPDRVLRIDVGRLSKAQPTSVGMRIPAALTRTGVFTYMQPDGSKVRELRHPDDVFHSDSLSTARGIPITVLHPKERRVTPVNYRKLAVGHASDEVRQDGTQVASTLYVHDGDALRQIDSGDLSDLSCGYDCRIDQESGIYEGQEYDVRQRDIVYNHVALLPPGTGRAGSSVALRLDDAGSVIAPGIPVDEEKESKMDVATKRKVRVDGIEYDAGSDSHLQATDRLISGLQARVDKAEGELASTEAKIAELTKERDQLKGRLDAAEDPKAIAARVAARAGLLKSAADFIDIKEDRIDSMSDREIMLAVVQSRGDSRDFKEASDDYVRGVFDGFLKTNAPSNVHLDSTRDHITRVNRGDADDRQKMTVKTPQDQRSFLADSAFKTNRG